MRRTGVALGVHDRFARHAPDLALDRQRHAGLGVGHQGDLDPLALVHPVEERSQDPLHVEGLRTRRRAGRRACRAVPRPGRAGRRARSMRSAWTARPWLSSTSRSISKPRYTTDWPDVVVQLTGQARAAPVPCPGCGSAPATGRCRYPGPRPGPDHRCGAGRGIPPGAGRVPPRTARPPPRRGRAWGRRAPSATGSAAPASRSSRMTGSVPGHVVERGGSSRGCRRGRPSAPRCPPPRARSGGGVEEHHGGDVGENISSRRSRAQRAAPSTCRGVTSRSVAR